MRSATQTFDGILSIELEHSERTKAGAMAMVMWMGVPLSMVLLLPDHLGFTDKMVAPERRILIPALLAAVALFETVSYLALGWLRDSGRNTVRGVTWLVAGVEAALPSLMMVVLAWWVVGEEAFSSPMLLAYGAFIPLSALTLRPARCLFSGAVAAGSYLGGAAVVGVSATVLSNSWVLHGGRAAAIWLIGVASALVAHQLRRRIEHSATVMEERNHVVGVFGRYITDEVVDVLLNAPGGLQLGGRKQAVTLIMTDLRGFSNLSEALPAERVVSLLNHYLGAMTEVIQACGGTIDEFIGDAILVVFNAPLEQSDHAARAVRCALAMQREMEAVNVWNRERHLPTLEMGVGVHTGEVVVGNIGSERRQKYGVVGSDVNLTARIESYTVGGQVLISEHTAACIAEGEALNVRSRKQVHPKGSVEPVTILDVVGLGEVQLEEVRDVFVQIQPAPVALRLLHGKDLAEERVPAVITALSSREALLQADVDVRPLDNLVIEIGGGQAFVKVSEVTPQLRVHFTARDEQAGAALGGLVASGAGGELTP